MKKIILFIIGFFVLCAHSVSADEGWVINKFDSKIAILKTGEVEVTETIDVDFKNQVKHGIFREIPYTYEEGNERTYTEINIENVIQNGLDAKYKISRQNGYVTIQIGDPGKTISGKNQYKIVYTAKGVLRGFSGYDELYWNVTGSNWPVVIESATASVMLPGEILLEATCFEGYAGSTANCKFNSQSERSVSFATNGILMEGQGLTVVVGYEKNVIPILEIERPKSFWEKFTEWPSLTTLFIVIFSAVGTVMYIWHKNGRDYWYGNALFGNKNDSSYARPVGAYEATVVEFIPPEKLRPAEIGVLMDEKADTLDVVSTIIDLAQRGYLTITEIPKKWVFGKADYVLDKKNKKQDELLKYEKMLLDELFKTSKKANVSDLNQTFYDELKKIKEELYTEVVNKKFFPTSPEKVRGKYIGISLLLIFAGIFLVGLTISSGIVLLADLFLGVIVGGIALLIMSRHMPRRTAHGRDMYRRIKGYRFFIEKAEKHRQKFFEKKNLINEVLPYAIVFGLTGKFAKAMEKLGIRPETAGWYIGGHHTSMYLLGSSMNDFSNSMSQAIASTPSSSGGFSGGSSGGGFSGGGGGSW